MHTAGDLVLRGQPRAEQQRIVRAQRHRHPGLEERPQRYVLGLLVHPQRHIRRRADLAGHPAVGQPPQQRGILRRPDAVPDPPGMQIVQTVPYARRPRQLTAVRRRQQTAGPRDGEGPVEVPGEAAPFIVGQTETDHAPVGVAHREPGERTRLQGVLHAVRGHQDADAQPGVPRGPLDRVQDDLQRRDQPAQPRRVRGRVDLDLQPLRAVPDVLLGGLAHQPLDVLRPAQTGPGEVVEPLEAEPAALVRGPQPRRLAALERVGQMHAVLVGELQQGRGPHRTREVQVQVGLWQLTQITNALHWQILPYGSGAAVGPGPERRVCRKRERAPGRFRTPARTTINCVTHGGSNHLRESDGGPPAP